MAMRPLETLLAIKVLALVLGLNNNDRRVATVLLEHFNRRTGQCDPGLNRISELLGISTRTVMRANRKLEAAGLFRKTRHGGHLNRNSYEPNWARFAEYETAWRKKFKTTARSQQTKLSPEPCQPCHIAGDKAVTQTCRSNLHQETCSKRHAEDEHSVKLDSVRGPAPRLGHRSADAARNEAERRWSDDLHRAYGSLVVTYGEIIEAIDEAIRSAATDAELKKHGGGLRVILDRLRLGAAP